MEQIACFAKDSCRFWYVVQSAKYGSLIFVLLFFAGCGDHLSEREKFEFNKLMWGTLNIRNYDFSYRAIGTLADLSYREVKIRDGELFSLTDSIGGEIAAEGYDLIIEAFFERIESRLEQLDEQQVSVGNHSQYYFPVDAAFNTEKALVGFVIFDFRPVGGIEGDSLL